MEMVTRRIERIAVILLTLALLITSGPAMSMVTLTANAASEVSTWEELRQAIEDGETDITIAADLYADSPIEIKSDVSIKGKSGQTIYQKKRDTYDSMFKVESGTLTLGEKLTLSGKTADCSGSSSLTYNFYKGDGTKLTTKTVNSGESVAYTPSASEIPEGYTFKGWKTPSGNTSDGTVTNNATNSWDVVAIWEPTPGVATLMAADGAMNTKNLFASTDWSTYVTVASGTAATDGGFIVEGNKLYFAKNDGTKKFEIKANPSNTDTIGYGGSYTSPVYVAKSQVSFELASSLEQGKSYVLVDGTDNSSHIYYFNVANNTMAKTADTFATQSAKVPAFVEGNCYVNFYCSSVTEEKPAYTYSDTPKDNGAGQGCDGATPECPGAETYTNTSFPEGTADDPKGFFVEVTGGKAVLDGATLENFITSRDKGTTPKFVAPVAVVGANSSFDVQNGAIKNNIVGYIVNDDVANQSADVIKAYVKGAAPNAQRTKKGRAVRRNAVAGIDDGEPGSGITGTAGAVIYSGGATGTVSGGDIGFNRGDTGGIFVTGEGSKVTLENGTNINNNVGVQFGGGTTVEDGGFIAMTGGTIQKNVAWFGGGAVYATENGIKWLLCEQNDLSSRKDGWFTLDGGTLDGNTSFTRGGAILADSDGVSLLKGKMINNMSRMLGGAVYVMGDHPDFSYTVYIKKGYVHGNKAVSAGYKATDPYNPGGNVEIQEDENQKLSRKLQPPASCEEELTDLFSGEINANTDDLKDGYPNNQQLSTDGTGGGVWLCAYGNTSLDLSSESQFYIDGNFASGSVRNGPSAQRLPDSAKDETSSRKAGGNDIHKDTRASGNMVITGVDSSANWYDENSGNQYTTPTTADEDGTITDFGLLNLVNKGTNAPAGYNAQSYDGVDVSGNISRRGGGLAADGSFVFGKNQNVADIMAEMKLRKAWSAGMTRKPVVIKVFVEEDGKKAEINRVKLTGTAQEVSELDTVFDDGTVDGKYQGRLMLPVTAKDEEGNAIQVFNIKVEGENIDLTDVDSLTALAQAIRDNKQVTLDSSGRKITFEEYVLKDDTKDDISDDNLEKTDEFELSPGSVSLDQKDATIHNIKQKQVDGSTTELFNVSFTELYFNADVVNEPKAEIEKYVNQAVHKDIAVDEIFEYDVLAYVKHGSDKLIIEDTLVDDLEFVSNKNNVKVTVLDENNHKPFNDINDNPIDGNSDASVHVEGTTISTDKRSVDITNNKLTVTIANKLNDVKDGDTVIGYENADDEQYLTPYWGKWVKVSFKAQIKESLQNRIKAGEKPEDVLKYAEIKAGEKYQPEGSIYDENGRPEPNLGNNPVISNEGHKGVENTASYKLEVKNEGKWKDESNTVTVKPQQPEVEKYVNQAVHKNIALDEVFTYDIIGFISTDADKVEFEDNLVDCLELVNTSDIEVVSLESNNHKPTNNISGEKINDDASVAEDGTSIKNADGLTLMAEDEGDILSVVIDDKVTVNEEGTVIVRTYNTVKGLRGKYVKITFQAQIKKEIQNKIKSGEMTLEELLADQSYTASIEADGNTPVDSDEAHDSIKNNAAMKITVGNKSKYELETNTVTVKPELPEIEKYVNQAVHDYIDLNEEFTYDIIAYVTKDADTVLIKDTLDDQLEFVSGKSDVKVTNLGKSNNHKPVNDIYSVKINDDATVAEKGSKIDNAVVNIEDNMLSVSIPDASALRGNWVKVTFKARIRSDLGIEDLKYTEIDPAASEDRDAPNVGNDPVISKEKHDGVPNKASYKIGVKNSEGIAEDKHKDESNTVTVKPEKPEIEKFVDQAVHKDINIDDEFTYDIVAFVTDDAATVKITDELDKQLQFVSGEKDVKISDLGKTNNHKVTNDIAAVKVNDDASVAEKGNDITDADVSIKGNKLVVEIPDASAYRGHWVKVTFKAKIADGKKVQDLKYTEIKDADEEKRDAPNVGNDPVISDEDHKGVPNKASYEIGVKNSAGKVETKYDDESNTVTVKPDEIPVYFSKKELDGDELEGAKIVVKDEEGNVIEEWESTKESHRIDLKPGKYSMQEVVAPDGFQRVTTTIWFEVSENGKVTLLTAEVDNGGKISIMDADHIILEDAPVKNPLLTIKKTSKTTSAMPGDVIDYVITIENKGDGDADAVEVEDTMDDNLTYVSDDSDGVNDGQKVTWTVDVPAGKTVKIKIKCRINEDASGKTVNKAEITNYETEFVDNGDDEHDIVLGVYDDVDDNDDKNPASKDKSKTKGARTGDSAHVVLWSIILILTLALAVVLRIRRRYQR